MQEGTDTRTQGTPRGVMRAALLGLSGGLLLGGFLLLFQGLRTRLLPVDCSDFSEVECGIMRDTAVEVGRLQSVGGAALIALGAAVVVLLYSRTRQTAR